MFKLLAFVMDPIERVNVHTDTSFAFMLAAQERGARVLHVAPAAVGLEMERVVLRGRELRVFDRPGAHYEVIGEARVQDSECAAIFIRTDPPFDEDYLTVTWILSFAERRGVRVVNSPTGLRAANEKLYTLEAPELCPATIVSASRQDIRAFMRAHGGQAIIKPINGHGGEAVLRLRDDDSNTNGIIDVLTRDGRRAALVQEYLEAAKDGDKRLILIDGKLRGALRRVPSGGDHRSNVHVGGRAETCSITAADERIAKALGERLRRAGLYFVGLDVVGDRLTDVNVTSPTLVRELKRLGGPDLAAEVVAAFV